MSDDHVALWQRWFDEVWGEQSESAIDAMTTPETIYHGVDGGFSRTEAFKAWRRSFLDRFSDVRGRIMDPIVQGDRISIRTEMTLTERESGAVHTVHGQQRAVVRGGRFVEVWDVWSWAPVLEDSGMIEPGTLKSFLTPTST